jgi:hypothetical protein
MKSLSTATPDPATNDGRGAPADAPGFTVDGFECWPSLDDIATWLYVPGPMGPERNPQTGVPTLSLLSLGSSGVLQCGTQWAADSRTLDQIRATAAEREGLAEVRLLPAPVAVKTARLELVGRGGASALLQETTTSNFTPYTALFHVPVDGDQMSRIKEAVGGSPGIVTVSYVIVVQRRTRVTARLTGSIEVPPTDFDQSPETLRGLVKTALAAGQLTLEEGVEGPAPDELRTQARNGALDRAAAIVQTTSAQSRDDVRLGAVSIDATVTLAGVVEAETSRTTDVAKWWQSGGTPAVLGGGAAIRDPSSADRSESNPMGLPISGPITLGQGLKGAPIAFVRATAGDTATVLRGPDFTPASLSAPIGAGIPIFVHYTDGGPSYETSVSWRGGPGCTLGPTELGIVRISLDASARKEAGAENLSAKVAYSPSAGGTADTHEMRFRFGDWTEEWFVISRDPGLAGQLTVEWREVARDGSTTEHPLKTSQETNIRL